MSSQFKTFTSEEAAVTVNNGVGIVKAYSFSQAGYIHHRKTSLYSNLKSFIEFSFTS